MKDITLTFEELRALHTSRDRRVVLRRPIEWREPEEGYNLLFSGVEVGFYCTDKPSTGFVLRSRDGSMRWHDRCAPTFSPFGKAGDLAWVREDWLVWEEQDWCDHHSSEEECTPYCRCVYVSYAATPRHGYRPTPDAADITFLDESTPISANPKCMGPWNPGADMPEWAARFVLRLDEVDVARSPDGWVWVVKATRVLVERPQAPEAL